MKGKAGKIPLEQYLYFYLDPWRSFTSLAHLKEIVAMHGLLQLHNQPKMHIVECLASIELMPPARSTLEQSTSPLAFLMADEVAADLADLGWQDCHVRSLITLDPRCGAAAEYELEVPTAIFPAAAPRRRLPRRNGRRPPPADFVILGRRPRSKRKRISINALGGAAFSPTTAAAYAPGKAASS